MADLKTDAIVLKRVNYREGDRIITFLTPDGRLSAIAKGARKEKSKLAGGIEILFLVSSFTKMIPKKPRRLLMTHLVFLLQPGPRNFIIKSLVILKP